MAKTIQQTTFETQQIYGRLKALADEPEGSIVTYDELEKLIGQKVQAGHAGYGYLGTARRQIERETGRNLCVVVGVGIRFALLEDDAGLPRLGLKQVRKVTAKNLARLGRVGSHYDKMSREQQKEHNTVASVLGVLQYATRANQVKKIAAKVEPDNARLAIASTLAAIKNGGA